MASSHYQKTCSGSNFISCGLCRAATDSESLLLLTHIGNMTIAMFGTIRYNLIMPGKLSYILS